MRFFRNLKALQTPLNTILLLAYFQAHSGPPLTILKHSNHLKNPLKIEILRKF